MRGPSTLTKAQDQWLVKGHYNEVVPGKIIFVQGARGMRRVTVGELVGDKYGRIVTATFTLVEEPVEAPAPARSARPAYSTCRDCGERWHAGHGEDCTNFSGGY